MAKVLKITAMPRTARAAVGGICYHVINRSNARGEVFHKPEDYAAFCQLLQEAADRVRMRVLAGGWNGLEEMM